MKQLKAIKKTGAKKTGFILPLILVVSLLLGAGMMAMAARAWLSTTGSIRQSQGRQAKEIAEAGMARIIEELNSNYAYLLIEDLDNWNKTKFVSSVCNNSNLDPTNMSRGGLLNNNTGLYILKSYDFKGSRFYGGSATLKIKGLRIKDYSEATATENESYKTLASAMVEQTVLIKPKACDGSLDEPVNSSGFPGLMGQTVTLGNNDVFGKVSGNVFCLQCLEQRANACDLNPATLQELDQLKGIDIDSNGDDAKRRTEKCLIDSRDVVAGNIYLGSIDIPPVPTPPDLNYSTPTEITTSETITAGDNTDRCRVDNSSPPITHCVVSAINMRGGGRGSNQKVLTVDTTQGPVRIYVDGDVDFSGGAAIKHVPEGQPSTYLGLFGHPADSLNVVPDQSVNIAGASTSNNLWIYFPDGKIGINGGSKGIAIDEDGETCDELSEECTGGDIYGAVWGKEWNGSSSTVASVNVPDEFPTDIFNDYGENYALGIRDYVAAGVTFWKSFIQK